MRKFILCTLILLLAVPAWAASKGDLINLDKTPWGMPFKSVLKALHIDKAPATDQIVLKASIDEHEAGLIYVFNNEKLVAVNVQVSKGLDVNKAKKLFARLETELASRYGVAQKDKMLCPAEPGCVFSRWTGNDSTDVILQRDCIDGREQVTVVYVSRAELEKMAPR